MRRIALLALCLLAACSSKQGETISMPIEGCTDQATGRTQEYYVQGACPVSMNAGTAQSPVQVCTMYQQIPVTQREVVTTCQARRWL